MLTAHDIRKLLAKRFKKPAGWHTMFEVGNARGSEHSGRADCIAFNLWPSRGHKIHGFEIKVSRSDWQDELNNPKKADKFCELVDHWWIVAPTNIVLESEVPATWGNMVAGAKRLFVKKDAPLLRPFSTSQDLPRSFVSSLIDHDPTDQTVKQVEIDNAVAAARKDERAAAKMGQRLAKRHHEDLERAEIEFKAQFGVSWLHSTKWPGARQTADRVKAAVALIERTDRDRLASVRRIADTIIQLADSIEEDLK